MSACKGSKCGDCKNWTNPRVLDRHHLAAGHCEKHDKDCGRMKQACSAEDGFQAK